MKSVDGYGNPIENRHTKAVSTIDAVTAAIWDGARRGGAYHVKDIVTGSCRGG